jgi:hypothetical protein
MTLSQETVHSLPVPSFTIDRSLLIALVKSEKVNKVYKQNAGSAQENVKHPLSLVANLNDLVLPEYAGILIELHGNSDIDRHGASVEI